MPVAFYRSAVTLAFHILGSAISKSIDASEFVGQPLARNPKSTVDSSFF